MRTFAIALLLPWLSACSAYQLTRPQAPPIDALAPPPAGKGQICVLRPHWIAGAVLMAVRDDGVLVGATRGVTYFCYYADPGHHRIESQADATTTAELEVAAGGSYYLHQIVDNVAGFVRARLAWVAADAARELIDKCGYRVLSSVPGDERLPAPAPIAPAATTQPGA